MLKPFRTSHINILRLHNYNLLVKLITHNYYFVSPTSHRADFGSKFRKRPSLNRRPGGFLIYRLFLLDYDGCYLYNCLMKYLSMSQDIIRPVSNPIKETGHIQILRGDLAPDGSVAKITGKEGLYFSGNAGLLLCFLVYTPHSS